MKLLTIRFVALAVFLDAPVCMVDGRSVLAAFLAYSPVGPSGVARFRYIGHGVVPENMGLYKLEFSVLAPWTLG